jgi:hypothetical protein
MVYGTTKEAAEQGAKLLNLMSKSGDLGNNIKDALLQNPKIKELLDNNPELPFEVMNIPQVTKLLMNNPEIVDMLSSDPSISQSIVSDPIKGMLNFLQMYKNRKGVK